VIVIVFKTICCLYGLEGGFLTLKIQVVGCGTGRIKILFVELDIKAVKCE
jgi:hypothetical protein